MLYDLKTAQKVYKTPLYSYGTGSKLCQTGVCRANTNPVLFRSALVPNLKDECSVDALRACVFIYLPYILKNNVEFQRK